MNPNHYLKLIFICTIAFFVISFGANTTLAETATPTPTPTPTASPTSSPAKDPKCPETAPPAGPSFGTDYQAQIAQAYQEQLSQAAAEQAAAAGQCTYDESAEKAIVDEAMKFGPAADGKTKYKYVAGGMQPSPGFNCSGFVDYVLRKAKAAGANIDISSTVLSRAQAGAGQVIHKIDIKKFTLPSGGAKLRTVADMPKLEDLRPGDLVFFGTAGECPDKEKCPNTIGHVGIYLGNGKIIHSTTSDKDINRDSKSTGNPTSQPPFTAHPQGSLYADYNGVKIDDLYSSYFTPGLYIQTNRVTHTGNCATSAGAYSTAPGLGTTTSPGGAKTVPSFKSCHGRTPCFTGFRFSHSSINGWSNPANGDAIDLGTDGNVYAAFAGTATKRYYGRAGGSSSLWGIRLTSSDGKVVADYVHTNASKTGRVSAGEKIGTLCTGFKWDHIHFELAVNGQTVHGDPNSKGSEGAYQKSLWANMKKVLGLI